MNRVARRKEGANYKSRAKKKSSVSLKNKKYIKKAKNNYDHNSVMGGYFFKTINN